MNTGRSSHSATLLNSGKVLLAGGSGGQLLTAASAELYDSGVQIVPVVSAGGVVNSASYGARYGQGGSPSTGIAQGSLFLVFGQDVGPESIARASSFPLPSSQGLAGTSIRVNVSGVSVNAIMLYTMSRQVAAVLPSDTPLGTGTLTITNNGVVGTPVPITVVRSSFGAFGINQGGSGPGVIQNVNSETDRPLNSPARPARAGQTVVLWGTGLGAVSGDEAAGPLPGDLSNLSIRVFLGSPTGPQARVLYRGRSGCCTGVDQIAFEVPQGIVGCFTPVLVEAENILSNSVSMSIAGPDGSCDTTQ
jgi:uncharacterized protein (TIGR03437 family)